MNPEQLLVLSAASCQLLSFLALAARAGIDVIAYEDRAEAEMPDHDRPVRITRITLHPRITLASDAGPDAIERAITLVARAHDECYVANSLRTEITVEPEVRVGLESAWATPNASTGKLVSRATDAPSMTG